MSPTTIKLDEDQLIVFTLHSCSIEHESGTLSLQLASSLEIIMSMCLQVFLEDNLSELCKLVAENNLDLTSVASSMKQGTYASTKCNPASKNNVHTALHANIGTMRNKIISNSNNKNIKTRLHLQKKAVGQWQ